jgi:hypothetical protein
MWMLFNPTYACAWTFEKEPGCVKKAAGGKWICGLQELHNTRAGADAGLSTYGVGKPYAPEKSCVVYSIGSNGDFSFEERVRATAPGCTIITIDPTYDEKLGRAGAPYDKYIHAYGLAGSDLPDQGGGFPLRSIASIMRDHGHDHIDVLKFDVEGWEWSVIAQTEWANLAIGQVLTELHPWGPCAPTDGAGVNAHMLQLERAGYFMAQIEPVTASNYGQVEVTFINKDFRPTPGWWRR